MEIYDTMRSDLYKNIVMVFVLCIGVHFNSNAQSYVAIGDMEITLAQQRYGAAVKNKSVTGEQLSIAGEKFTKGIGVHAKSSLKIKMYNGLSFSAKVGVNDSKIDYSLKTIKSIPLTDGKRIFYTVTATKKQFVGVEGENGKVDDGSVIFTLLHNGKEVFNSGVMRKGDTAKDVNIQVKGGVLEMVVEDAGDGLSGDHAVWIDPRIDYFEIAPILVSSDHIGEVPVLAKNIRNRISSKISRLPVMSLPLEQPDFDWLINNSKARAEVYKSTSGKDIIISNGLIARVFRVLPNLATIDYINQMTGESLLRAVSNEGVLTIDGKAYTIGGLSKQPEYAYTLMKWVDQLAATPNSFLIKDFEVKDIADRMKWKRVRWASNREMPTGKELIFTLVKDDIEVKVHYELYDGLPTLGKWI